MTKSEVLVRRFSHFCYSDLRRFWQIHVYADLAKGRVHAHSYEVDKDFQKEAKAYWRERTGLNILTIWHDFYSYVNGIRDVRYVPEDYFHGYIEPFFNRTDIAVSWDDKCYYSERFPPDIVPEGLIRPPILLRNADGIFFDADFQILSPRAAAELLSREEGGFVVKDALQGRGGKNITFANPGDRKSPEDILSIFEHYKKDFVAERFIFQCEELAALNPTSINTIRMFTYLDRGGAHLLSSCMRIGGTGSRTDNFSSGGISCGVEDDGTLKPIAYDQQYNSYKIHPSGAIFAGRKIPAYEKAKDLVLHLHPHFGHFRTISWDVTITPDHEPLLIEFNLTPQGIDLHQINNGPLFGDFTEEVLSEVFGKKTRDKRKED